MASTVCKSGGGPHSVRPETLRSGAPLAAQLTFWVDAVVLGTTQLDPRGRAALRDAMITADRPGRGVAAHAVPSDHVKLRLIRGDGGTFELKVIQFEVRTLGTEREPPLEAPWEGPVG